MKNSFILFALLVMLLQTPNAVATSDNDLLSLNCNGCHGTDSVSIGQSIPSIAGLEYRYFMRTMLKFRKGERASTIMDRISRGYKIRELRAISKYFAALEWINTTAELDTDKVQKGLKIHNELCEECHEKNGRHQDKDIPRISGQQAQYLFLC